MSLLAIVKYTNVKARRKILEKTSVSYDHLMMSTALKLSNSGAMATRR